MNTCVQYYMLEYTCVCVCVCVQYTSSTHKEGFSMKHVGTYLLRALVILTDSRGFLDWF